MRKKEHPEIARIRRFQESLDLYSKPPPGFPRDFGVIVYNKKFDSLRKYFFREEMKGVKEYVLGNYPAFKEMTDRAIDGQKPTDEDIKILRSVIPTREVKGTRRKNRWFPELSPRSSGKASPFVDLLFGWVYYVWREDIKVRRCKTADCDRIFVPTRSDQNYCSPRCYDRQYKRTIRALSSDK